MAFRFGAFHVRALRVCTSEGAPRTGSSDKGEPGAVGVWVMMPNPFLPVKGVATCFSMKLGMSTSLRPVATTCDGIHTDTVIHCTKDRRGDFVAVTWRLLGNNPCRCSAASRQGCVSQCVGHSS